MGVDRPNYTQIPNLLLDDLLPYMNEAEMRVTLALTRLTFGYHRDRVEISLSKLQEVTRLSRQGVINGINAGIERGTIGRTEGKRGGFIYEMIINGEHPSTSQRSRPVNEVDQPPTSQPNGLPLVNQVDQTSQRSRPPLVNEVDQNTPVLKKVLKKEERKRERKAPARKLGRISSPHFDPRRFVAGLIPTETGATPVEVYYERFSIHDGDARLNAIKEDDLAHHCPDLDKLREVVTAYSRTNYKPGNVQLILDWYRDGIPEKHRGAPANGLPKPSSLSEAEKSKIITRARNAMGALKTAQQFKGNIDPAWQEAIDTAKGFGLL